MRSALPFAAIYLFIAFAMFLLMRDHAFHPTDDGFVLAYSWRVLHGEVPYRDFVFERTPLTPYLHTVWLMLPDGWQISAGRLAYYLEMAASALMPTVWAASRGLRANHLTLAVAGATFLIALNNFPPMPWMTVDAVLFASAGATALLVWRDGRRPRWLAFGVALFSLAVLARQSFAPLLGVAVACGVVEGVARRDRRTLVAAIMPAAALTLAFVGWLLATDAFAQFVFQLSQPTQMRPTTTNPWTGDVVAVAVLPYALALTPGLLVLIGAVALAVARRDESIPASRSLPALALGLVAVATLLMPNDSPASGFVLFYGVAACALAEVFRRARGLSAPVPLSAYGLVLLVGWCSSLSFAYQTPILAMGMAAAVIAPVLPTTLGRTESGLAVLTLFAVALVAIFVNVEKPYRDLPREQETADLGEIYPRLGHLYTNPANAERHRELRELSERLAISSHRDFVVLTAFPLAHYLSGTRNPLSVDWVEPQEYLNNDDRLAADLERSQPVMLVERQDGETVGEGDPPLSCEAAVARAPSFASAILSRSRLVGETTYFCAYAP